MCSNQFKYWDKETYLGVPFKFKYRDKETYLGVPFCSNIGIKKLIYVFHSIQI